MPTQEEIQLLKAILHELKKQTAISEQHVARQIVTIEHNQKQMLLNDHLRQAAIDFEEIWASRIG